MSLSLTIHWADEVAKKLKKLSDKDLDSARSRWLGESAIIVEWAAKKEAPVGAWILRKYIKSAVYSNYAVVYNNLPYAEYVHKWTRPHIFLPRIKKALYWKWVIHLFKAICHPWTLPNPFFLVAVNKGGKKVVNRFREIVDEYLE